VIQHPGLMPLQPPVFIPLPDALNHHHHPPTTPEMDVASGPSSLNSGPQASVAPSAGQQAPPHFHTAMAGLLQLGMPGLRLPHPALGGLLSAQSILAGMNAAAGPAGFFFGPPALHLALPPAQQPASEADDMELEEADDNAHHPPQRRGWTDRPAESGAGGGGG